METKLNSLRPFFLFFFGVGAGFTNLPVRHRTAVEVASRDCRVPPRCSATGRRIGRATRRNACCIGLTRRRYRCITHEKRIKPYYYLGFLLQTGQTRTRADTSRQTEEGHACSSLVAVGGFLRQTRQPRILRSSSILSTA